MAKGKHAAASANRRLEAAQDHIDRLTDQLTEAKLRARQVERVAAQVPKLQQRIQDDAPIVQEVAEWWRNGVKNWAAIERRLKYLKETVLAGYLNLVMDHYNMTLVEAMEWMTRKYPDLFMESSETQRIVDGGPWARDPQHRRLSDEAVRRIQQKNGDRHIDTPDAAKMWQQIDEAIEAGFTGPDLTELVDDEVQADFFKGMAARAADYHDAKETA